MFNEQKVEKIRSEIKNSRILDDHEKADWLNLLELMNDKQIGELEEILQSPSVQPQPSTTAPPMPILSHISNLPTQIATGGAKPRPQPTPVISNTPKPAIKPFQSHANSGVAAQPTRIAPSAQSSPFAAKPAPLQQQPARFESLENLGELNLESFRKIDSSTVTAALEPLVQQYGYFAVLQALESAKLYESYIATGKKLLSNQPLDGQTNLTQAEFELMTDMLRTMRVNQS